MFWCRTSELKILINRINCTISFALLEMLGWKSNFLKVLYCIFRCQEPLWNFNSHFLKKYKQSTFLKIYKHTRWFPTKYKNISELSSQLQLGFQPLSAPQLTVFVQTTPPGRAWWCSVQANSLIIQVCSGYFTSQVPVAQGKHLAVKTIRFGEKNIT